MIRSEARLPFDRAPGVSCKSRANSYLLLSFFFSFNSLLKSRGDFFPQIQPDRCDMNMCDASTYHNPWCGTIKFIPQHRHVKQLHEQDGVIGQYPSLSDKQNKRLSIKWRTEI
jgi:hypothetical protein